MIGLPARHSAVGLRGALRDCAKAVAIETGRRSEKKKRRLKEPPL